MTFGNNPNISPTVKAVIFTSREFNVKKSLYLVEVFKNFIMVY